MLRARAVVPFLRRRLTTPFSTLTYDALPKHVKDAQYAVRGAVLIKGEELAEQLKDPARASALPFKKIVACNIGNPQAVGQAPLRFHRQVLACLADPSLIEHEGIFPEDVRARAVHYLNGIHDGAVGAYSHSKGHKVFRQEIVNWLERRDGVAPDPEEIFLTDGASAAVKMVLQMAIAGKDDGVLLPIPQYPLYSATLTLLGGQAVPYYLDEEQGWSISKVELERAAAEFKSKGGKLKAIAVINPGNPTGQVLSREVVDIVLEFAEKEGLMVMADEVYQNNLHAGKPFVSFRKLAMERGTKVEVFSFHSVSKGVTGECGLRGGLVHGMNVDPKVFDQMYKLASISLCSNVLGQALMASVVTPPPADGPSRALFDKEETAIHQALKRKAKRVTERLNAIDGISCQPIEGAMYAFPNVTMGGAIAKEAQYQGVPADQVYCLQLVEKTGIIAVPGSGFGQKPGTNHLRLTILPDEETLEGVLDEFEKFHKEFAC